VKGGERGCRLIFAVTTSLEESQASSLVLVLQPGRSHRLGRISVEDRQPQRLLRPCPERAQTVGREHGGGRCATINPPPSPKPQCPTFPKASCGCSVSFSQHEAENHCGVFFAHEYRVNIVLLMSPRQVSSSTPATSTLQSGPPRTTLSKDPLVMDRCSTMVSTDLSAAPMPTTVSRFPSLAEAALSLPASPQ
jgi:hypothetical protein